MMPAMANRALAALLLLAAGVAGVPAARAADVTGRHVLPNGLEVRLLPSPGTPLVATLVLVRTGYALEGAEALGFSHLLEHLIFAGTEAMGKEELFRRVEAMGGYLNGFTRDDYMGYLLVGHRDDLAAQAALLSGILFEAALTEKALEEARAVVLEEIRRSRSRPETRVEEMFQALLYEGSSYARTGLGSERTVTAVTRERLLAHYRQVYRPDNMVLLMMGGFEPRGALEILEKSFGAAAPGALAAQALLPSPLAGRQLHTLRAGIPDQRLQLAFNGPDPRAGETAPLELLAAVLGGDGGRLKRALDAGGFAPRSVSASLSVNRGFSRFLVSASLPAAADGRAALGEILAEIGRVAGTGPAAAEVEAARFSLEAGEVLGRERLHYHLMGKAPWVIAGDPGQGLSERRWDGLGAAELAAAAATHLAGRPHLALLSTPAGAEPEAQAGAEAPRERHVLPNGMVVVAEQRPGSEVFALNLLTRRRSAVEPPGKAGIADFLHRLLPLGTATRGKDVIERQLRELGASLTTAGDPTSPFGDFYTSRQYSFVRLECLRGKAGEAVALAAELVGAPALPAEEVERVRGFMTDFVAYKEARPESAAARLLAAALYGPGGLASDVQGTRESLAAITREDLRAFQGRYLVGRNLVASVVSGLPPAEAAALVSRHFSALPEGEDPPPLRLEPTRGDGETQVQLGKPQGALAVGAVTGAVPAEDRPALALVASLLNDRLNRELREREGLAYAVGASLDAVGDSAVFTAGMGTAAAKLPQARASLRREIEALRSAPVEPKELAVRAADVAGKLAMRMLSSVNRGFYLALAEREGAGHTYGEDYRRILLGLEPAKVEAAARAYLPTALHEALVR